MVKMVRHKTKQQDNMFKAQLFSISKILERYHHVQVFDIHSDIDSDDEFDNIYEDDNVRIVYNHEYDYIEILADDLCIKGEIIHLFVEQDPDNKGCCRVK